MKKIIELKNNKKTNNKFGYEFSPQFKQVESLNITSNALRVLMFFISNRFYPPFKENNSTFISRPFNDIIIANCINLTRQTVKKAIKELIDKDYIINNETKYIINVDKISNDVKQVRKDVLIPNFKSTDKYELNNYKEQVTYYNDLIYKAALNNDNEKVIEYSKILKELKSNEEKTTPEKNKSNKGNLNDHTKDDNIPQKEEKITEIEEKEVKTIQHDHTFNNDDTTIINEIDESNNNNNTFENTYVNNKEDEIFYNRYKERSIQQLEQNKNNVEQMIIMYQGEQKEHKEKELVFLDNLINYKKNEKFVTFD